MIIAGLLLPGPALAGVELTVERPDGSVLAVAGAEVENRIVVSWRGEPYLLEFGVRDDEIWTRVTHFEFVDTQPSFHILEISTSAAEGEISAAHWAESFSTRKGLRIVVERSE